MLAKILLPMLLLLSARHEPAAFDQPEADQLQASLQRHLKGYSLKANSFLQALTQVASQFRIPIGIQWIKNQKSLMKVDMSWDDATVYDIIESIARSQPGYSVSVSNGVVHIFPRKLTADKRNFLNLRIKELEAHGELFDLVNLRLQDVVRQTVSPPPPKPAGGGMGFNIGSTPGEKVLTFRLEDVTVENALDVIASLSSEPIWVVTFCDVCGLTPTGFLRTVGLWRSTLPPDDLQPRWDAFRWGDAIPTTALQWNK